MTKKRSYSEVVKEGKVTKSGREKENDTISKEDTVITKNVSKKSHNRLEGISKMYKSLIHTNVMLEMKETLNRLKKEQHKMRRYIRELEKVVISLVNKDNRKDSYKRKEAEQETFKTKRNLNDDVMEMQRIDVQRKIDLRRMQRLKELKSKILHVSTRCIAYAEDKAISEKEREHDTKVDRGRIKQDHNLMHVIGS